MCFASKLIKWKIIESKTMKDCETIKTIQFTGDFLLDSNGNEEDENG